MMKKHLLVFFTGFLLLSGEAVLAQAANITFPCSAPKSLAPTSGYGTNETYNFTSADCDGNGFSVETVGTNVRVYLGTLSSNYCLRLDRNAATGTWSYARFYSTAGTRFSMTSISVCPSNNISQNITIHGYAAGTEVTNTVVSYTASGALALVNVPSSQFTTFTSVDELRFTTDASPANGVIIDNIVTGIALPVTWLDFNASQQGSVFDWNWSLGVEDNVGYYTPQYSVDGVHFTDAGKVFPQPGSHSYNFSASLALAGNVLFRVRETDLDGKESYSSQVALEAAASGFSVYPNPVAATLNIQWPYADAKTVTVVVYNSVGKLVRKQTTGLSTPIEVSVSGLGSGTYFVFGEDDQHRKVKTYSFLKVN